MGSYCKLVGISFLNTVVGIQLLVILWVAALYSALITAEWRHAYFMSVYITKCLHHLDGIYYQLDTSNWDFNLSSARALFSVFIGIFTTVVIICKSGYKVIPLWHLQKQASNEHFLRNSRKRSETMSLIHICVLLLIIKWTYFMMWH